MRNRESNNTQLVPTVIFVLLLTLLPFLGAPPTNSPDSEENLVERAAVLAGDYGDLRQELLETRQRLERTEQSLAQR